MTELLGIHFKDLFDPLFYINHGGIWIVLMIVFAETGIMIGFFLPGDSLLFVSGIYSQMLISSVIPNKISNDFFEVFLLFIFISIAGILGNECGYWFGGKSGALLYSRKDSFLFKKKYLFKAEEFYDKHGPAAIILARFLPIVRTFAPVIAGIVQMDKKKFFSYSVIGSSAWVFTLLMAGHYLQKLFLEKFGYDLRDHLLVIIISMVCITTGPVVFKLASKKSNSVDED